MVSAVQMAISMSNTGSAWSPRHALPNCWRLYPWQEWDCRHLGWWHGLCCADGHQYEQHRERLVSSSCSPQLLEVISLARMGLQASWLVAWSLLCRWPSV